MKRLFLALSSIGFAVSALAALPGAPDPTEVSVPLLAGGFSLGLGALYLEPSVTNGDLEYASVNSGTSPNFITEIKRVDPDYDWGFKLHAGYDFADTGNDIALDYFHIDTDDSEFLNTPVTSISNLINPTVSILDGDGPTRARIEVDQVDLTGGQLIDVGCRLKLHPKVGVRWDDIQRKTNGEYTFFFPLALSTFETLVSEKSIFDGIGPLLGIDGSYYIGRGVGVVGHFDGALLVGHINSNLRTFNNIIISGLPAPVLLNTNVFDADSKRRIAYASDAKLGANYTFLFQDRPTSSVTLEAGYQVNHYYNVIDRVHANGTGASATVIQQTTADLAFQGPYVSVMFHG